MDKEIKRIKINKLYSESNLFKEIVFCDGVNIILGEKHDDSSVLGRKTNGVGKSLCVNFIDFCLLSDYDKSRISKIPKEVFPLEEKVILELEIGDEHIVIKRSRKNQGNPEIVRRNKITSFDKIQDARTYLAEIVFNNVGGKSIPSFRNLISILLRDERSEFSDIIKCHDLTKRIPDDLSVHLYMLQLSLEKYKKSLKTIKEIEDIGKVISRYKNEVTENKTKKIADVKAELNALNDDLEKMELAIDSFKSNEAFDYIQGELVEIENVLDQLRNKQKAYRYEYNKIRTMPKPEEIDDRDIELVYNQFKEDLGDAIVKTLNEVVGFKNKVEEFQQMLINQKSKELEIELENIAEQIRELDDSYAEKLKIIDQKGVLKNLKTSLKVYESKKDKYANISVSYKQLEKNEKTKKMLRLRKNQEVLDLDADIENKKNILDSFTSTVLGIHEMVMGNKESSFSIDTIDSAKSKSTLKISMRIFDDGSHSVNRSKVFIYDMALLFNQYTRMRHPLFLIHDNIFDVDQDTLVQCLNYLEQQEEKYQYFQYILTLNRDKIENEENIKLIKMDINSHKVATFTKEEKFLKRNYQES